MRSISSEPELESISSEPELESISSEPELESKLFSLLGVLFNWSSTPRAGAVPPLLGVKVCFGSVVLTVGAADGVEQLDIPL